ncbi:MAG: hypothetical protein ACFCVG_06215 [Kineosporiaceae bacterium]
MLIRPAELAGIRAGAVDLGFRRWERPRVVVGTRMRTPVGLVEVTSVDPVDETTISEGDARRAGAASLDALRRALAARSDRPVYRVGLRWAGEDPRIALRQRRPPPAEAEAVRARLDRLDAASPTGPWTRPTLEIIDRCPAVRAPDLAAALGRDTASFKRDVRKLKDLGLTESLDIGYRLSPRGEAVVDDGGPARERPAPPAGTRLPAIGAAATRALTAAGLTTLEAVAAVPERDLAALHGVGPVALGRLRAAVAEHARSGTR